MWEHSHIKNPFVFTFGLFDHYFECIHAKVSMSNRKNAVGRMYTYIYIRITYPPCRHPLVFQINQNVTPPSNQPLVDYEDYFDYCN